MIVAVLDTNIILQAILTDRPNQPIAKIRSEVTFVAQPLNIYRIERDRKDEVFINVAIAVSADYLVSRDNDLLDRDSMKAL